MMKITGAHTKSLLAALALALFLLIAPAAAQAGDSGGVGPGGTDTTGGTGSSGAGEIEGLSPEYTKFSKKLSSKTELSLRVVGAWTLAEGGPKDNPLNIGPGRRYGTVNKGVRATASLLKGSSLYEGVMESVNEADGLQIKAIANSPWCPGCRGYARLLRSTYKNVEVW
ncbi:MAG: hypothetical protein U0R24_15000 [Solirubrobacterales bacterium]